MKTMRDKFEELPEISMSIADGEIYFDEKEDCYIATDVEFYYDAGYANGARYAFQERDKEFSLINQYTEAQGLSIKILNDERIKQQKKINELEALVKMQECGAKQILAICSEYWADNDRDYDVYIARIQDLLK